MCKRFALKRNSFFLKFQNYNEITPNSSLKIKTKYLVHSKAVKAIIKEMPGNMSKSFILLPNFYPQEGVR